MAGWELVDPREDRMWCRHVLEAEVAVEAREAQLPRHGRMLEECPQLGAEHEGVRAGAVVEGLLAHAVPRQEEQSLPDVPDREGEHAVERRRTVFSVFLVCMHDNFRVGLRTKPVTPALELIAEGLEVGDLPVVG